MFPRLKQFKIRHEPAMEATGTWLESVPQETLKCDRSSLKMDADGTGKMSRKTETAGVPKNRILGKYARSSRKADLRDAHIYQHERERFMEDLRMASPVQLLKPISVSTLTDKHGFRILVNVHCKTSLQWTWNLCQISCSKRFYGPLFLTIVIRQLSQVAVRSQKQN